MGVSREINYFHDNDLSQLAATFNLNHQGRKTVGRTKIEMIAITMKFPLSNARYFFITFPKLTFPITFGRRTNLDVRLKAPIFDLRQISTTQHKENYRYIFRD